MNRRTFLTVLKAVALGLVLGLNLVAQTGDRFLDQPRPASDSVRLVIFNPIVYNLKGLATLREQGILAVPGLTVIGVYHARQKEDFDAARKFVQEQHLDWVKFHMVSAPIAEGELFQKNACTPDIEAVFKQADGVIFFGGSDIPAAIFGQKTNLLSDVEDPFRNYLELSAIFHLLGGSQNAKSPALLAQRPGFPILGICLGFQSLNVGTGGSLTQDIWTGTYRKHNVEDVIALGAEQCTTTPTGACIPWTSSCPTTSTPFSWRPRGSSPRAWASRPRTTRGCSAPTTSPWAGWARAG